MEQDTMKFDVLIIGAGPSGLSAAIKLKQLALEAQQEISICILEKGAQVGSHILAGAVLEPESLRELLPKSWKKAPLDTPVTHDLFYFMTQNKSYKLPTPKTLHNHGNFIISLEELCKFLAEQAEQLGCEIYPGFAAQEIVYNHHNQVIGVTTGSVGIDKHGVKTANYQPGMRLLAKQTLFAEGCRGQLSQVLMARYHLRDNSQPQTYGLGIKELWAVKEANHAPGTVVHTVGWPMDNATYGGSFLYHFSKQRVAIGFVVGLDYKNPWLSPFEEFQRFKTHPLISSVLQGGERLCYGARAINEGGWQSLPKLSFPGGALIGDAAGFLNVPKIKGIHTAMQSGMLAAQACFEVLDKTTDTQLEIKNYAHQSKLADELHTVRN
ncbi:MAG: NAD(P)/FAD-dependent oxidoreductase, partial [Legionella sp.]